MKAHSSFVALLAAVLCASAGDVRAADGVAKGNTSGKKIALSNNYAGNAWRQAMLRSWEQVTKKAIDAKLVSAAPAFTTAENQVTEQAAQLQNLILQGYDAIVINAASPTALNGVIKQACDAGIVVVSFDAVVEEPCAYRIVIDFAKMGSSQLDYLSARIKGPANLLEIRGLAGTFVDDAIHSGIEAGVKKYPNFKVAGSVHGDWAQTVAQREVAGLLPSLPKIDAVVTQGGDGFGAAQAFKAAGRPMPIIIMGNRQDELLWWKQQRDASGYKTTSMSIAPAVSQVAFWVAQQVLAGKEVPKDLMIPTLTIDQKDLDFWLAQTPEGGVTNANYTQEWVVKVIDNAKAGKAAPPTPQ